MFLLSWRDWKFGLSAAESWGHRSSYFAYLAFRSIRHWELVSSSARVPKNRDGCSRNLGCVEQSNRLQLQINFETDTFSPFPPSHNPPPVTLKAFCILSSSCHISVFKTDFFNEALRLSLINIIVYRLKIRFLLKK